MSDEQSTCMVCETPFRRNSRPRWVFRKTDAAFLGSRHASCPNPYGRVWTAGAHRQSFGKARLWVWVQYTYLPKHPKPDWDVLDILVEPTTKLTEQQERCLTEKIRQPHNPITFGRAMEIVRARNKLVGEFRDWCDRIERAERGGVS